MVGRGVGVCKRVAGEIAWRGVQPSHSWLYMTGSPLAGMVLSAVLFGAAHAMQGFNRRR